MGRILKKSCAEIPKKCARLRARAGSESGGASPAPKVGEDASCAGTPQSLPRRSNPAASNIGVITGPLWMATRGGGGGTEELESPFPSSSSALKARSPSTGKHASMRSPMKTSAFESRAALSSLWLAKSSSHSAASPAAKRWKFCQGRTLPRDFFISSGRRWGRVFFFFFFFEEFFFFDNDDGGKQVVWA